MSMLSRFIIDLDMLKHTLDRAQCIGGPIVSIFKLMLLDTWFPSVPLKKWVGSGTLSFPMLMAICLGMYKQTVAPFTNMV